MKKTKLTATVITMGCLLTACGGNNQTAATVATTAVETSAETEAETTIEETTAAPETAAAEVVALGQTAALNNWNITVTNIQMLESVDNGYGSFAPDEGNKYLLITTSAENTGKEADTFLPSFGLIDDVSAKVLYGDGYEFSLTNLLGYSRNLIDSTINPLSSKEGDIAFELPNSVADSSEPLFIEFSAGTDKIVFSLR